MWFQVLSCLAVSVLAAPTLGAVCPESCMCQTTSDGLHHATCGSLASLYKFTLRQKHHNINVLDLSHNNITKLSHELDRLTEVVSLDLSTNGIQQINKFLHNAKKLVHLNLANNRIKELSLLQLPKSVSSLDLSNNLLRNVPADLGHLVGLEHLELDGNPLDCSCDNLLSRDRLVVSNVYIDDVKCVSPLKFKGRSWLEIKIKEICKNPTPPNDLDLMMGDQPIDAVRIGYETTALKSMSLVALEDGNIIHGKNEIEDDDSQLFLSVKHPTSSAKHDNIEGSGEYESTTISGIEIEPKITPRLNANLMADEEVIPFENSTSTDDPLEGSGEGSGFLSKDYVFDNDFLEETTTEAFVELIPPPVVRIFEEDSNQSTTEYPLPEPPKIFRGGPEWNTDDSFSQAPTVVTTEKLSTSSTPRDTTVSEHIRVTQASEVLSQPAPDDENVQPHKTGTYVCIAIIVVLLVGLIGFAIGKGQMRRRRDRRLLRQQKRDVEKASKEMVDMNKSLLGKPAPPDDPIEKKINGKYELVPTHEVHTKKGENGNVSNGVKSNESNAPRTDSPRDSNQNKNSSIDNNLADRPVHQETSFESPASPDSRKDSNSLASEDIFVPINEDDSKLNGIGDSDISHPLVNGTDSDFLSPSREYVPVYSPDMGRVRIKMSETPKPKTPVLVTRSRSNAGDIVVLPADESATNARKSTT